MAETDKDDIISDLEETEDIYIPLTMPVMPVRDVVIFTNMLLPLFVGREKSVRAAEEAVTNFDQFILLVTQKDPSENDPKPDKINKIGTVAKIIRMLKLPDGRIKTLIQGITRAKIVRYSKKKLYYTVDIEVLDEKPVEKITLEIEALMRNVRQHSEKILNLRGELSNDIKVILESIDDPGRLADLVASNLSLKMEESQKLLELVNPVDRLTQVNDYLVKEVELSTVQAKIQSEVQDEISKNQRDYFLREQVRAINKELGDYDEKLQEIKKYKTKIKKAKMSKQAQKEAEKELKRLDQMHFDSSEASIIRTYLDWLVELPWSKSSKDFLDIKHAKKILDKEHHGLDKIKDRILEYLSVRKLNPKMKGPILCFAGPPGVGKTSLGQAIARAMKRKFVRISLGGIRDEAEIRGHRRTYIGALPGRILQGLKQCKTNNPVFMMDEIDKLCSDFRGDPSSALLEALDPEQNYAFSDHYLNLAFDLSKIMFILTANMLDSIPSALLDRMEIINLSGYTEEEKQVIVDRHLFPRQRRENGVKPRNIKISNQALKQIIREYTCEAGLRNLERELGKICRKVARKIAEKEKGPFKITRKNIHKYLGIPKYEPEMEQEKPEVGISTGLAWTQAGGETLYIEVSKMQGKGELIITGQLGEVMQESVRTAVSYARATLNTSDNENDFFEKNDIHIHVPAGAIPKDGPSAGIAIFTALASLITNRRVSRDVAMTGEISLRGRALPIGGLKEKSLGALRAGIKTIVIPEKNKKDLIEIPATVKRKIKFIQVKHADEVLDIALEKP
ncbi:Lon protease [Candidatus Magnetomoraceae bacterium gMMP-13]